MAHDHHHNTNNISETKLIWVIALNLLITAAEVIGGIMSGSLSLISDALHNFSDSVAVFSSLIAIRIGKRKPTDTKTFGYKRAEILVAFFNAATLVGISVYLFVEAYHSFKNPQPIDTNVMIPVAIITFIANLLSTFLLQKEAKESLNMKSAYLHLLADAFVALAVLVSAFLMKRWQVYWLDPLLTVVIGILVIRASYDILKTSLNILMQGIPEGLDIKKVREAIEQNAQVANVHNLHVWQLNDRETYLDAHIQIVSDATASQIDELRHSIKEMLHDDFEIENTVLQIEYKCDY